MELGSWRGKRGKGGGWHRGAAPGGAHHDIMPLHLGLLAQQLLALQLQAAERSGAVVLSIPAGGGGPETHSGVTAVPYAPHPAQPTEGGPWEPRFAAPRSGPPLHLSPPGSPPPIAPHLWYCACRNWNSSLIRSQISKTENLKGCPGCGERAPRRQPHGAPGTAAVTPGTHRVPPLREHPRTARSP